MTRYTPPKPKRRTSPILYVGPELDDTLDSRTKEGIVRRRILVQTGRCPCGASMPTTPTTPGVHHVRIEHENGCPAIA
jgi:hypothetical protein